MKANYNVTGEDRKQMVAIISREAGVKAVYTRMPECAFVIGSIKVSKTGEMIWDARTDAELIEKITAALIAVGFTAQAAEPEAEGIEEAETTEAAEEAAEPEGLTITLPRADFTENALSNLKTLVASKQALIKKALQADSLEILTDDEKVSFPWWNTMPTPEQVAAYSVFLTALIRMAKEARRVTATERATESEKYTFRTFLLRLGFIGGDHKATRAILMEHLSGHAAFKNQADADAFYAKMKEKKAAAKAAGAEQRLRRRKILRRRARMMRFPNKEMVERIRQMYPAGTRVVLTHMDDPQAPPVGTKGTVLGVDDTGSLLMEWDNGSGLNVVYGEDHVVKVGDPDA